MDRCSPGDHETVGKNHGSSEDQTTEARQKEVTVWIFLVLYHIHCDMCVSTESVYVRSDEQT